MYVIRWTSKGRIIALISAAGLFLFPSVAAIKNMAVVVAAGSKLQDVPLAELVKLCKGAQKTGPDGHSFTLVMKDPESPDMRIVVQKLFAMSPTDLKTALA